MARELRALYELQSIDTQIARVEKACASLDDGSGLRVECERVSAEREQQRKLLHDVEREYNDRDLELRGLVTKRQKHREKLFGGTLTNPKELESQRQEIEMLTRNKGALEEKLLLMMDVIETHTQSVKQLAEQAQEQQQQCDEHLADYRERLVRMNEQLAELRAQRAQAVEAVRALDESLLDRYHAMLKKAHNLAIVKVDGSMCPGCGVSFTSFAFRRLRDGDPSITCENCGRMLYYEE